MFFDAWSKDNEMTSLASCLRLSVLGAKGVGKTAIIVRYLTRRFIGEYHSQIDITYRHMVSMSNGQTQIIIMDFSAKNDKDLVPDVKSLMSDCFLVVFSIDDRSSFLKAVNIVSMLRSFDASTATPITLLGNKKDLEHSRQVSTEELINMSCLLSCQFAEVSAAESREDIVPIVFDLIKRVSFPEEFDQQEQIFKSSQQNDHSNFSSEPCLYEDLDERSSCVRKRDRSVENYSDRLTVPKLKSFSKVSDFYSSSRKCEICCLQHDKYPSLADLPPQFRSSLHPSRSTTTRRKLNKSLPTRTYSLNLKDRRNQSESIRRTDYLIESQNSSQTLSDRENSVKREIKKDSYKLSSLLNCSKGERYSDSKKPLVNKRSETPFITSMLLRGRSFTNENRKGDSFKFGATKGTNNNSCKGFARARKTLPYRFLSTESSTKDPKIKRFSFDIPRPSSIRMTKPPLPEKKNLPDANHPPEYPEYLNKKSLGAFDSLFIKKMGKASMEGSLTPEQPLKSNSFLSRTQDRRERKFGVFGISAIGSVFSKTSLPDLPKAASFYNKFDSFKNTIKKRSV